MRFVVDGGYALDIDRIIAADLQDMRRKFLKQAGHGAVELKMPAIFGDDVDGTAAADFQVLDLLESDQESLVFIADGENAECGQQPGFVLRPSLRAMMASRHSWRLCSQFSKKVFGGCE